MCVCIRKGINFQLIPSFLWDLPVYPKMENNKSYLHVISSAKYIQPTNLRLLRDQFLYVLIIFFFWLITEEKNIQFQMLKWGTFY